MNKIISSFIILLSLIIYIPHAHCSEITSTQKGVAIRLVESYTSNIVKLHNSFKNNNDNLRAQTWPKIVELFCYEEEASAFDETTGKTIPLMDYINNGRLHTYDDYAISYYDVQSAQLEGWYEPVLEEGEETTEYIAVSILKKIEGPMGIKERMELIIISLEQNKIFSIVDENSIRPRDLFVLAIKHYNEKDYDNALRLYEKTILATNNNKDKDIEFYKRVLNLYKSGKLSSDKQQNLEQFLIGYNMRCTSLYSAAIMYIKRQGCKSMKRREREDRAYDLLMEAKGKGVIKAYEALEALGVYE